MKWLKRAGRFLVDVIEIYLPMASFIVLFVTFIFQIFCRYILNRPIGWSYEVGLITFVWTTMFGALYAWRDGEHIVFSLVYDGRSQFGKRMFDLIGSLIVLILMALIVQPTWKFIMNQRRMSSVLKISYKLMYFPFFVMVIGSCLRQVLNVCRATRALIALSCARRRERES